MQIPNPSFRAAFVTQLHRTGGAPPTDDPLVTALFEHTDHGVRPVRKDVAAAYRLFTVSEHRGILDAFILSGAVDAETQSLLRIDPDTLQAYKHLFMDPTVFANRLEVLSYVNSYDGTDYARELIRTAVQIGPEYLYWAYGKNDPRITARYVIERTMIDAYFRGLAHKGNALTAEVTKEAHKWWNTAVKNAELAERINPSSAGRAVEELRIALGQQDETATPAAFAVPLTDILH